MNAASIDRGGDPPRAVVVDGDADRLDALVRLLAQIGVVVVTKETDPVAAVKAVERTGPDLVILILSEDAPEERAALLDALARTRRSVSGLKAIVLGESADPTSVDAVFAAGASAYIAPRAGVEEIAAAIRQSFSQSLHFAPSRAPRHLQPNRKSDVVDNLTAREREVLTLIAEGYTNAAVAKALFVTEQTVKYHLSNVFTKLNVTNRTQASRWAHAHGLLGSTR